MARYDIKKQFISNWLLHIPFKGKIRRTILLCSTFLWGKTGSQACMNCITTLYIGGACHNNYLLSFFLKEH